MKYTENQKRKILEKCMTFSDIEKAIDKINASKGPKIKKSDYFGESTASFLDKDRLDGKMYTRYGDVEKVSCADLETAGESFKEECIREIREFHERNPRISTRYIHRKECLVYGDVKSDFSSGLEISNKFLVKEMSPEEGFMSYAMMMYTSYGDFGAGPEIKKNNDGTTEFCSKGNYIGSDEEVRSTSYKFSPYGKLIEVNGGDYDEPSARLKPDYKEKVKNMKEKVIKENLAHKHEMKNPNGMKM